MEFLISSFGCLFKAKIPNFYFLLSMDLTNLTFIIKEKFIYLMKRKKEIK